MRLDRMRLDRSILIFHLLSALEALTGRARPDLESVPHCSGINLLGMIGQLSYWAWAALTRLILDLRLLARDTPLTRLPRHCAPDRPPCPTLSAPYTLYGVTTDLDLDSSEKKICYGGSRCHRMPCAGWYPPSQAA
jgi:hypothetical protein